MKKLLISTALGAMLIAGGVAVAQSGTSETARPMRGMYADANKDGKLSKAEVTSAAEQAFAKMDADGDGKVTKEERQALRQKRLDERFARIDADGNGQISKTEFVAQWENRYAKMAEWRDAARGSDGQASGPMRHRSGKRHGGMWGMDADKDGTLTRAEFMSRPVAMFERADANKDGTVTAEEMKAAHPGRGHRGQWRDMPSQPKN